MKRPSNALENMLDTGEYSDLIIATSNHQFKVHRAVVYPQSPAIKAALKTNAFKMCHAFQDLAVAKIIHCNSCMTASTLGIIHWHLSIRSL
jgi:hypothetical protein